MTCLLDTHFLLWILLRAERLTRYPWLERYRPWGVSPVSLLELAYLSETGRIDADVPALTAQLLTDVRFTVDEAPLLGLIRHALPLAWTRDPFDRLLVAHSTARRARLCTADRRVLASHSLVVEEVRR